MIHRHNSRVNVAKGRREPTTAEKRKAVTLVMLYPPAPARELTAWMHVPSQPLMRSPLSQFQTPTVPRRVSLFFRVWSLVRLPFRADHPAYFESATFYFRQSFSAVDACQPKQLLHGCQCRFSVQNLEFENAWVRNAIR
jgi:hypothetical protein